VHNLVSQADLLEKTYDSSGAEEYSNAKLDHVPWVPECQEVNNAGESNTVRNRAVVVRITKEDGRLTVQPQPLQGIPVYQ
jgi:hypothetical protein